MAGGCLNFGARTAGISCQACRLYIFQLELVSGNAATMYVKPIIPFFRDQRTSVHGALFSAWISGIEVAFHHIGLDLGRIFAIWVSRTADEGGSALSALFATAEACRSAGISSCRTHKKKNSRIPFPARLNRRHPRRAPIDKNPKRAVESVCPKSGSQADSGWAKFWRPK